MEKEEKSEALPDLQVLVRKKIFEAYVQAVANIFSLQAQLEMLQAEINNLRHLKKNKGEVAR